ncbi:MAG: nuclease family protein [Bacteroidetes bacterium]|nr:nuclease family protein [Bacteroidota bacterium]
MQSFLEKTVIHLHEKYGDDISELCIVLPNRRAGLFLKTHFSNHLKKTFWSPEILATEDFVALLSELQPADPTTLLFDLYETVKKCTPGNTESFDEFSKWGQILLSDFNEIDRYLVDAKQLFGNLKNIKELETWSLNSEEGLTDFQKQYLVFWQQLGGYYTDFAERMLAKKEAYQGLAYRIVAADPVERAAKHPWKKIIFAGFNALNLAEEIIIEKLVDADKAEIIWDTDSYYVNNPNQEAGRFIRKYNEYGRFKKIKERNTIFEEILLSNEKKQITIIGAAKNVAQAKIAGSLVTSIEKEQGHLQNTALVLADENLLFPVLHSLPASLQDINVTMGYPLKNTPVAGYFELVFNLHENAQKIAGGKLNYRFYHTDLVKLLSHPYTAIALASEEHRLSVKPIVQTIQGRNIVFAAQSTLTKLFDEHPLEYALLQPVFKHWTSAADAIACVQHVIEILKNGIIAQQGSSAENKSSLELEYLFAFTKIVKRIQVLMQDYPGSVTDVKTLRSILNQIVRAGTLPFYGEPLMGLQVMGMLETRTLDFENVILLSCNEDILPSGKAVNSFIPFELKRHFGLPTYSDKDAIFAYHFYRLLQRATTIYLLYNTESDALGSGERSRFLTQLAYELPKVNPNVTITEQLLSIPVKPENKGDGIIIYKTAEILEKIKARSVSEHGFSPSLLNKYRSCSVQFYFHGIAGLREADEVEETIGADVLGNVIHSVLEQLYQPFVEKKIGADDIKKMKPLVEALTMKAFDEYYSRSEISYGKNLLTLKVALKFIANFLDAEIAAVAAAEKKGQPVIVKALEQSLETELIIAGAAIKIKGKADRIDSVGSITRIVDYKTGLAANNELKFDDWDLIRTDGTLSKSFQLLMYAYLYQKMNPAIKDNLQSGIITFRELSAGLKTVKANGNEFLDESVLKEFEAQLEILLTEIVDPEIPFTQTTEVINCVYCSFRGVCHR